MNNLANYGLLTIEDSLTKIIMDAHGWKFRLRGTLLRFLTRSLGGGGVHALGTKSQEVGVGRGVLTAFILITFLKIGKGGCGSKVTPILFPHSDGFWSLRYKPRIRWWGTRSRKLGFAAWGSISRHRSKARDLSNDSRSKLSEWLKVNCHLSIN